MKLDEHGRYIIEWGRNKGKKRHATYLEAETDAANYLDPNKIMLDRRRSKVMELRQQRGMKLDEIVDYINAHGDKYLVEGGTYSPAQLQKDLIACLRAMRDKTTELAKEWLPTELYNLEKEEDEIESLQKKLYDLAMREDPSLKNIEDYEKVARTFSELSKRKDAIRNRRAKYLPLETPKKVDVRQQNVYGTVEDYLALKKEQEKQEQEAIEGEFEEAS